MFVIGDQREVKETLREVDSEFFKYSALHLHCTNSKVGIALLIGLAEITGSRACHDI